MLDSFNAILKYLLTLLTLPSRLFSLLINTPTQIGNAVWWLPAGAVAVLISMIVIACIFKIFGREG